METKKTAETTRLLRAWMLDHEQHLTEFLAKIVNIDSATLNRNGVEELAGIMAAELASLGFQIEWRDPDPVSVEWINRVYLGGLGAGSLGRNIIGRLKGGTGIGRLLLVGHLDTAFPPGETLKHSFRVEGSRAYGPGVADMKGGVAGICFACRALIETGVIRPEMITVIYNTDEQAGSVCSKSLIEEEARRADWGLVTEPGREGGQVVGQRSGLALGELIVEGVEAHVGTGFRKGRSAIEALCRKIVSIYKLHDPDGGVVLNVGKIHGGSRRNLFAHHAEANIDLRVTEMSKWELVQRKIREIAATEEISGTHTTLHLLQHRPPMAWTKQTDRLAELVAETAAEMHTRIETIPTMGASDANLIAGQNIPVLCGLGPVGGSIMTADEYIDLPSLVVRASLVAGLAHKLSLGKLEA